MPNSPEINHSAVSFDNQKDAPDKIEIRERISRADLRADKDKIFLFGDNLSGRGYGGQAREMRGEENAVGIPTKKAPDNKPNSFFSDKEFAENKKAIDAAFGKIPPGKTIVIPKAGIGTGLAQLSEKAPNTFAYLNERFGEIGFDNERGVKLTEIKLAYQNTFSNAVVIQNNSKNSENEKRLLNLDDIKTNELRLLSPLRAEIDALEINRAEALTNYANRLRQDYRENKNDLRDGFKILSDALDRGASITVSCACRAGGEMCHSDVVKMAIEKVNFHLKNIRIQETGKIARADDQTLDQSNLEKQKSAINPRTQRAITEILAVSEYDRNLEKINQTDGRNRSEQASYLGKISQFVRDVYEHGGNVIEGKLIIPKENLSASAPLAVTTSEYAVKKLGEILNNEAKAKEIAPMIVEYGNKIAGLSADGETKLKVFNWIYDSLQGKSEFLDREGETKQIETNKFDHTLNEISRLAADMHELEPLDRIEFVPLAGFETEIEPREIVFDYADENRLIQEIYEEAVSRDAGLEIEKENQFAGEIAYDFEKGEKINAETFERIDLSENAPRLSEEFSESEITRLLTKTLPEIDRRLENGEPVKEILGDFHQIVRQSAKDDALNRLEQIYKKQTITNLESRLLDKRLSAQQKENLESEIGRWQAVILTPTQEDLRARFSVDPKNLRQTEVQSANSKPPKTIAQLAGKSGDLSQSVQKQLEKIDLLRQNVIELKSPNELRAAEDAAIRNFYRKSKQEVGGLLEKLDKIRENRQIANDKTEENALKKELNQTRNSIPSFAFKLENSPEIIVGNASALALEERNFVSAYINFQLKQPEVRLRSENERYRNYAARLEAAMTRTEVMKTASEVRIENAALGLKWKDLEKGEKEKLPQPLSQKEMQFLFTETSPSHYTGEMTAIRLSYAHAGASRREMTESLIKGEINASPEATKLIESLESRLARRELKDSISATRHFFESLKTPNENLKLKNNFDHQEIYRNLPPQEKDFVYTKTTQQKENLEYRFSYQQSKTAARNESSRAGSEKLETSKTEKSFHLLSGFNQARILGEKIESPALVSKEITTHDFNSVAILLHSGSPERNELISRELNSSGNPENRKIGEIMETFSRAEIIKDEKKTFIQIELPENSAFRVETYAELLEKFYPDDARENEKYKLSNFSEKTLSHSREKGQDETIKDFREEVKRNVYQSDAPASVFIVEQETLEKLDNLRHLQETGRAARGENEQILGKYASRAAVRTQNQDIPASKEQKEIVASALVFGIKVQVSDKTETAFFQAVQKEIIISDSRKFSENEKLITDVKTAINKEFAAISRTQNVIEESKINDSSFQYENKTLQQKYERIQQFEENRLLTKTARNNFETKADLSGKTIGDLIEQSEKDQIRTESFAQARIAIEPELKDFDQSELKEHFLNLADAIETAHQKVMMGAPQTEVDKAFELAENEREFLLQMDGKVEKSEDKPLSLRLYEAEIKRAEKELWTKSLGAKILAGIDYSESELILNLDKIFSAKEREQMKIEAAEIAKTRLEPKELDADHRKIPTESGRQAVMTFKQLEQAHNVFQLSSDPVKIREAFSKLDLEAAQLFKIRQDYNRSEKLAVLREGIKTDIADLLKKNPGIKENGFTGQASKILTENLEKADLVLKTSDVVKVDKLSREITNHIESKQKSEVKEFAGLNHSQASANQIKTKINAMPNNEKVKDSFVFAR